MRVTVTIPDEIGQAVEQLAAEEGTSVSALYAAAAAHHVRERRRQRAVAAIDCLIGQSTVAPDAADQLAALRADDAHRIG